MDEIDSLFERLRPAVDPGVAAALEAAVRHAPDAALNRINALAFAAAHGLDEDRAIAGFLHANRAGLFELSWAILCPSCGGVLTAEGSLRRIDRERYACAFCLLDCEPVLDEAVEVTFTVSPRGRAIAAHRPDRLPLWDYAAQAYFGSGIDLPAALEAALQSSVLDATELAPGGTTVRRLDVPAGGAIAFDLVTHNSWPMTIAGDPTGSVQALDWILEARHGVRPAVTLRPGPVALTIENRTAERALPMLWGDGPALAEVLGRRRPHLTAKRLLSHQTFRDLFRTGVLDVEQRLKIKSLTFLFTDLRDSTALYDRNGDLTAFDLVRRHFQELTAIIADEQGAVVKTIGDAVMATFVTPEKAVAAALRIRAGAAREGGGALPLKIALHEGPCLAVTLNDAQDYFGQTVNIAARLQALAERTAIVLTGAVAEAPPVAALIAAQGLATRQRSARLRGVGDEVPLYDLD